ncbi:MAG: Gfo/Idh/MocA family oxidoreductase [Clostridia bacterium]|nr:Gfo/Idh/MocA family oxidoreductase [Clostridia bacterium]
MSKKIWKVAVVGCGSFGCGQYLPNIAKETHAECVAVVDIVEERARKAAARFGVERYYTSVYELIEKCDFEIAIDAASIQAHHEINMAILKAGKHLISQKPAAPTVEQFTEQIELAEKMGVQFACAPIHPMRYDLNVAKRLIREGAIGKPFYAKCNVSHGGPEYFQFRDADPSWFFEPGAGALVDMGVHGLQIVTSLFGPAKAIACMAKVMMPERTVRSGRFDGKKIKTDLIPDQYVITLDYGEGRMAVVDSGFCEKASRAPQLEIFGKNGTVSFTKPYMTNPEPEVYIDRPELGIRGWITPMKNVDPPAKLNSQCCCLRDLVEAIEGNRKPLLSAEHARHILEIMTKIPEALEKGTTVALETTFEGGLTL